MSCSRPTRPSYTDTVDRVNQAATRVVSLLSDENQKNINETLRNFNATSKNLDNLSRNFDDFLKEARQSAKQIDDTIKVTEQVMANLQKATKPIADRSEVVMKNLEELTDGLNKTLYDTRELLKVFSEGDGTFKRLLTDASLYNNVNDTVLLLNRTLPSIDLILHNIEVFSDKLARHPELIGLGGAVQTEQRPQGFSICTLPSALRGELRFVLCHGDRRASSGHCRSDAWCRTVLPAR